MSRYPPVFARLPVALVLALLTLSVFWQVGSFQFIQYDDYHYVTENRPVLGGLTVEGVRWAFAIGVVAYARCEYSFLLVTVRLHTGGSYA